MVNYATQTACLPFGWWSVHPCSPAQPAPTPFCANFDYHIPSHCRAYWVQPWNQKSSQSDWKKSTLQVVIHLPDTFCFCVNVLWLNITWYSINLIFHVIFVLNELCTVNDSNSRDWPKMGSELVGLHRCSSPPNGRRTVSLCNQSSYFAQKKKKWLMNIAWKLVKFLNIAWTNRVWYIF